VRDLKVGEAGVERRSFIMGAAGAALGPAFGPAGPALAADAAPLTRPAGAVAVPADFTGLSYETPQLYNPAYFSRRNAALVAAVRQLGACGVLRFGGALSEYTRWRSERGEFASPKETAAIAGQRNWEWRLTDPSLKGPDPKDPGARALTPEAVRALRGFLDATDWRCIWGLNFGSGSLERAADEADHVMRILGPRLLCFQLGNEPDFFGGNPLLRSKPYDFDQYWAEHAAFVAAIRARQPKAPFAGPDVAVNLDWVRRYAEQARGDALFLSSHYYAMGPASDPAMTAERLLSRDERLERQIATIADICAQAGLRYRMTEGNSCFGGGKPGVSDAYASALWAADYMLRAASAGWLGVNLHGGGDGWYTPIEAGASGQVLRPLFHGMRFGGLFAGAEIARCALPAEVNAGAYFGRRGGETLLAVVNKSPRSIAVRPDATIASRAPDACTVLSGPDLGARTGVTLTEQRPSPGPDLPVPAYTAVLFRWRGHEAASRR
jgi:hypothetical protein